MTDAKPIARITMPNGHEYRLYDDGSIESVTHGWRVCGERISQQLEPHIVVHENYEPRRPVYTARSNPFGTWLVD